MQFIGILLLLAAAMIQPEQVGRPCPVDAKKFRQMCVERVEVKTERRAISTRKR